MNLDKELQIVENLLDAIDKAIETRIKHKKGRGDLEALQMEVTELQDELLDSADGRRPRSFGKIISGFKDRLAAMSKEEVAPSQTAGEVRTGDVANVGNYSSVEDAKAALLGKIEDPIKSISKKVPEGSIVRKELDKLIKQHKLDGVLNDLRNGAESDEVNSWIEYISKNPKGSSIFGGQATHPLAQRVGYFIDAVSGNLERRLESAKVLQNYYRENGLNKKVKWPSAEQYNKMTSLYGTTSAAGGGTRAKGLYLNPNNLNLASQIWDGVIAGVPDNQLVNLIGQEDPEYADMSKNVGFGNEPIGKGDDPLEEQLFEEVKTRFRNIMFEKENK